jgi:hypothetical protein
MKPGKSPALTMLAAAVASAEKMEKTFVKK